ncbi:hydroxyacyl-thioester dehydratase type 2, mitochondrial [Lethenteron reissneri]|uniref:hydroxyacyl-thioester dehydratase type 2, mitochondrial n=1 Tax=Lethenteron reissneri TaxID=7753 RepID=UPI002AB5F91B|nr:hydroxyacyl-thioester dehydratase type 2, mitochondrial [Lethenteron reissneri]
MSPLIAIAKLRVLLSPPTPSALLQLLPTATGGGRRMGAECGWRIRGQPGPSSAFSISSWSTTSWSTTSWSTTSWSTSSPVFASSPSSSTSSSPTNPATRVSSPAAANASFYSTSSSPPPTSSHPPVPAPAGRRGDAAWAVGDRAEMRRVFTPRDVADFARLTGDTNPVHDAVGVAPGRAVVHGVLLLGLVSALLGTRLPGAGCVLASSRLRFPAPLLTGDEVTASATVERAREHSLLLRVLCTTAAPQPSAEPLTTQRPGQSRPSPSPQAGASGDGAATVVVLEGEVLVMLPRDPTH